MYYTACVTWETVPSFLLPQDQLHYDRPGCRRQLACQGPAGMNGEQCSLTSRRRQCTTGRRPARRCNGVATASPQLAFERVPFRYKVSGGPKKGLCELLNGTVPCPQVHNSTACQLKQICTFFKGSCILRGTCQLHAKVGSQSATEGLLKMYEKMSDMRFCQRSPMYLELDARDRRSSKRQTSNASSRYILDPGSAHLRYVR